MVLNYFEYDILGKEKKDALRNYFRILLFFFIPEFASVNKKEKENYFVENYHLCY